MRSYREEDQRNGEDGRKTIGIKVMYSKCIHEIQKRTSIQGTRQAYKRYREEEQSRKEYARVRDKSRETNDAEQNECA